MTTNIEHNSEIQLSNIYDSLDILLDNISEKDYLTNENLNNLYQKIQYLQNQIYSDGISNQGDIIDKLNNFLRMDLSDDNISKMNSYFDTIILTPEQKIFNILTSLSDRIMSESNYIANEGLVNLLSNINNLSNKFYKDGVLNSEDILQKLNEFSKLGLTERNVASMNIYFIKLNEQEAVNEASTGIAVLQAETGVDRLRNEGENSQNITYGNVVASPEKTSEEDKTLSSEEIDTFIGAMKAENITIENSDELFKIFEKTGIKFKGDNNPSALKEVLEKFAKSLGDDEIIDLEKNMRNGSFSHDKIERINGIINGKISNENGEIIFGELWEYIKTYYAKLSETSKYVILIGAILLGGYSLKKLWNKISSEENLLLDTINKRIRNLNPNIKNPLLRRVEVGPNQTNNQFMLDVYKKHYLAKGDWGNYNKLLELNVGDSDFEKQLAEITGNKKGKFKFDSGKLYNEVNKLSLDQSDELFKSIFKVNGEQVDVTKLDNKIDLYKREVSLNIQTSIDTFVGNVTSGKYTFLVDDLGNELNRIVEGKLPLTEIYFELEGKMAGLTDVQINNLRAFQSAMAFKNDNVLDNVNFTKTEFDNFINTLKNSESIKNPVDDLNRLHFLNFERRKVFDLYDRAIMEARLEGKMELVNKLRKQKLEAIKDLRKQERKLRNPMSWKNPKEFYARKYTLETVENDLVKKLKKEQISTFRTFEDLAKITHDKLNDIKTRYILPDNWFRYGGKMIGNDRIIIGVDHQQVNKINIDSHINLQGSGRIVSNVKNILKAFLK